MWQTLHALPSSTRCVAISKTHDNAISSPLSDVSEQYGGVYIDVSVMLIRKLDDICWSAIEDPKTPYEVAGMAQQMREHPGQMLNSFIASRKGNPFVHRCTSMIIIFPQG